MTRILLSLARIEKGAFSDIIKVKMRKGKKKAKLVTTLLIAASILVTSCKSIEETFPEITPEQTEEVKNICTNLDPPSTVAKNQLDFIKSRSALRSLSYKTTATNQEVEDYFVKSLTKSGWHYTKEYSSPTIFLRFRRGQFAIDVEYIESSISSYQTYSVGCSWGNY